MSSGQQYWHDKEQDEALERKRNSISKQAKELEIPAELGLAIEELRSLVASSGTNYTFAFGQRINAVVSKLEKYAIK